MFEGLVVTKDHAEVKRGLMTFPLALFIQVSIIAAGVLWGVFSVIDVEAPSSIPIFSAPVTVTPPPPAGNPDVKARPQREEKPAAAPKDDRKEIVEPDRKVEDLPGTAPDNGNTPGGTPGVPGGVPPDWVDQPQDKQFGDQPPTVRQIFQAGEITAPRLVFSPPPEYPPMALRLGIRGKVEVEMVVDENGSVESVRIISSSNRIFDDAVLRTVRTWRFTPPVDRRGQSVAVYYKRTIAFSF